MLFKQEPQIAQVASAWRCSLLAHAEVRGSSSTESQQNFFPSQHWKNLGCHVAPSDWATCHPVIGPYDTVNTQSTCTVNMHSQLPHHHRTTTSPVHVNISCHLSTSTYPSHPATSASIQPSHPATSASIQPPVIHTAMCQPVIGPRHVQTATCHPYTATCQFRTGPTQPENAKIE
jgi:hypothetical protein